MTEKLAYQVFANKHMSTEDQFFRIGETFFFHYNMKANSTIFLFIYFAHVRIFTDKFSTYSTCHSERKAQTEAEP